MVVGRVHLDKELILKSGIESIDALLNGGFRNGLIYEIYGEAGIILNI